MHLILTSSPCLEGRGDINPAHHFIDTLHQLVPHNAHALFVTATPDDQSKTDWAAFTMKENLEGADLAFVSYDVLDRRTANDADKLIQNSDFIILGGGHVPTQNRFFVDINLRQLLINYNNVLMGISAGSMNCARTVYAQPEEPGESVDVNYRRFIPGLNLTHLQVLPHFNKTRHYILDGKRLVEDITFADSHGHCFYGLPDGSYIVGDGHSSRLFGEAYVITDGVVSRICDRVLN